MIIIVAIRCLLSVVGLVLVGEAVVAPEFSYVLFFTGMLMFLFAGQILDRSTSAKPLTRYDVARRHFIEDDNDRILSSLDPIDVSGFEASVETLLENGLMDVPAEQTTTFLNLPEQKPPAPLPPKKTPGVENIGRSRKADIYYVGHNCPDCSKIFATRYDKSAWEKIVQEKKKALVAAYAVPPPISKLPGRVIKA